MLSCNILMVFFNNPIPDGVPLKLPILNHLHLIFSKVNLFIPIFTLKNGLQNMLK